MSTPRTLPALFVLAGLAGCTSANVPLPIRAVTEPQASIEYNQRRSDTELYVKSNFPAVSRDVQAGGGPALAEAMETAGIPPEDRETRTIQLYRNASVYAGAPGALVTALMSYAR